MSEVKLVLPEQSLTGFSELLFRLRRSDHLASFQSMAWEVGQTYEIEASQFDGSLTLAYIGEVNLEWTMEDVHVFRTDDGRLLGLRNQDIVSAKKVT